jgi:dethiobiotin synthetase
MVLVRKPHTEALLQALRDQGVQAEVFRPIAGACSLTMM